MRTLLLPLFLLTLLFSAGCSSTRSSDATSTWLRSELYFGLSRRTAANVTPEEWNSFVLAEVVPAFPGGFTELTAQGYFSEDGKSHQEPVRVLVILNPPEQAAATSRKLDTLGRAYCRRFGQDAVLRADSETRLTFLHAD